jgi:hypothetical protein
LDTPEKIKIEVGVAYTNSKGESRKVKALFNGRGGCSQVAYWDTKGELKTTSPKKFVNWHRN